MSEQPYPTPAAVQLFRVAEQLDWRGADIVQYLTETWFPAHGIDPDAPPTPDPGVAHLRPEVAAAVLGERYAAADNLRKILARPGSRAERLLHVEQYAARLAAPARSCGDPDAAGGA